VVRDWLGHRRSATTDRELKSDNRERLASAQAMGKQRFKGVAEGGYQAWNTPIRPPRVRFRAICAAPICPSRRGGDLGVYAADVDHSDTPQRVRMEPSCRRYEHTFTLIDRLGPEDRWEFLFEMGMCPPGCAVVHRLDGES
jgi:hypothetical protein